MRASDTWLAAAGFTALAIVWTWPVASYLTDALPGGLGDELLNAWILAWDADRLRHGLAGWWDAPIFFPYKRTLAYSEHLLGVALFVAPLHWVSGNPYLTYNVAFIASYAFAAFSMYLLAYELTGRRDVAVVAGLAFGFTPYRTSKMPHLQVLVSGWMPLGLFFLTRYLRRGAVRPLAGFAAAMTLQALSNGYFMYYQLLPIGLVALDGLRRAGRAWGRRAAGLAGAGAFAALALLPIGVVYRTVQQEQGFTRSLSEIVAYSADAGSYLQVVDAVRAWNWLPGFRKPEGLLFPGLTVLVLTVVALWPRRSAPGPARGGRFAAAAHALWRFAVPAAAAAVLLHALAAGRSHAGVVVAALVLVARSLVPLPRTPAGVYGAVALAAFLLSLGPQPTSWGRPVMPVGPYAWLLGVVPGFDGLRVPARLAMIVVLGLSAAAAVGAARLVRGQPAARRRAIVAVLACAVLADGYSGEVPIASVRRAGAPEAQALADWIRSRPEGAMLHLPIEGAHLALHFREQQIMTLEHGRPIVNGYRAHMPAMHRLFESDPSLLRDPARIGTTIEALHSIGVRYVVIDDRLFERRADSGAMLAAIRQSARVVEEMHEGATHVMRLSATPPPAPPSASGSEEIPRSSLRVRASPNPRRANLALDGDAVSRWLSGARQSGRERFVVELDRPRDVAFVRLAVAPRSEGDYPRRIRVESVLGGGEPVVLFDGEIVRELIHGLVREPRAGPIDIRLPPNRTDALVLRQTGRTDRQFWSINELTLWER